MQTKRAILPFAFYNWHQCNKLEISVVRYVYLLILILVLCIDNSIGTFSSTTVQFCDFAADLLQTR